LAVLCLTGCVDYTKVSYGPFTYDLGDGNEVHISTYSAGYPRKLKSVPFIYKVLRSPDKVYFQVFVRPVGVKGGPNPNVESIEIRSFSYRFPTQAPVELISGFDGYFWMQGNPRYEPVPSMPVPVNEHWYLDVRLDMTLNGTDYLIEERIEASASQRFYPLIFDAME
jgi:hypothetical protein